MLWQQRGMILDSAMSRCFENLIRNNISDECHHAEVCFQFEECVYCDLAPHPPELEYWDTSLSSLLFDRVRRSALPIRGTERADDVLATFSQRRQNVFSECGLPYYGDSHVVSHICHQSTFPR